MKKRILAGVLLAALAVGFTAWYSRYAPERVRADALPPSVLALLPQAARYEKQTLYSYDTVGAISGAPGEMQTMDESVLLTVHCYDEGDRLVRAILYTPKSDMSHSYIEYQYDSAGRRTALISHNQQLARDGDSDIVTQIHTVYGADGRAVSEEQNMLGSVTKTTFSYDADGRKTGSWISYDKDGREDGHGMLVYDENDRIVWQEETYAQTHFVAAYTYDVYGAIEQVEQHWDGREPTTLRTERTYDAAGHALTETAYKNGVLESRTENSYDSAGRLLQMTRYDASGNVTDRMTYEQITR